MRDVGAREPRELDPLHVRPARARRQARPLEVARPPGGHDLQWVSGKPIRDVRQDVQRRAVGPLQVVREEHTRRRTREQRHERPRQAFVEALARARPAGARRLCAVGELGHEAAGLGAGVRVELGEVVAAALGERRADRLGDESVRELRLAGVRSYGHREGAERAGVCDVLLAQPRLADAGLALESDCTAVARASRVRGRQQLPFALAADEQRRRSGARQRDRRLGGGEPALVDRLVQLRRLGQGPHAQLAIQQAHAFAVLAQGLGALADGCEQLDQSPVRRLVEGIELQAATRRGDRLVESPRRCEGSREAREHHRQLPLEDPARRALPVVECHAVAEAEPGHQVVPVEFGRGREVGDLRRSAGRGGCELAEAADVDLDAGSGQRDRGALDAQPRPAEPRFQRRERPA